MELVDKEVGLRTLLLQLVLQGIDFFSQILVRLLQFEVFLIFDVFCFGWCREKEIVSMVQSER